MRDTAERAVRIADQVRHAAQARLEMAHGSDAPADRIRAADDSGSADEVQSIANAEEALRGDVRSTPAPDVTER